MSDNDRQIIATIWDQKECREALTRFFEEQAESAVAEIRAAVTTNDIVRAAISEGRLQAFEGLPKTLEWKSATRAASA